MVFMHYLWCMGMSCTYVTVGNYSPLDLSPVANLVVGLVCLSTCLFTWTYISITAGRIFLILAMMMGYDLGMTPVVSKF